jgi:ribonuclease BN (tRNA processing enzyme)
VTIAGAVSLAVTVLGSAGSHPGVGRLCSGLLVRGRTADGRVTHLVIDAGNGSTANLQRHVALTDLDAVVITHRHVDHCIDLASAQYALRFDTDFLATGRRIPVHAADGVAELLRGLSSGEDPDGGIDRVLAFDRVAGGDTRTVGPLAVAFADAVHPVPAVSVRVEHDGRVLVVSGDTAGDDALVALARGADLFVCEATWTGRADDHPPGLHLTAEGAAAIARAAGVGRLVLTHLAGATDRTRALAEARAVFDGPIDLAEDLATYPV